MHSNHESYVRGLAAWYWGFSAPAATARFCVLSFKSEKKSTLSGDKFHCHYKFGVYCHSYLLLSVKPVSASWIVRKYFFETYDGSWCSSPVLPEHRLADEFILSAHKSRQVKGSAFFWFPVTATFSLSKYNREGWKSQLSRAWLFPVKSR